MGERERERWGKIFYMDPDWEGLVSHSCIFNFALLFLFLFAITFMQFAVMLCKNDVSCSRSVLCLAMVAAVAV